MKILSVKIISSEISSPVPLRCACPSRNHAQGVHQQKGNRHLKECGLTTLETRRLRGDQIEVFKILNGYENIDRNILFTVKEDLTRFNKIAT